MKKKNLKFFGPSERQKRILDDLSRVLPSNSFFAVIACGKWREPSICTVEKHTGEEAGC